MDFWRAVGILNNRKWLIILSVIAATTLTWGATRLVGSKYTAEVKFMSLGSSALTSGATKGAGSSSSDSGSSDGGLTTDKGSQKDIDKKQIGTIDAIMKSEKVVNAALAKMNKVRIPEDLLSNIDILPEQGSSGVYLFHYSDTSAQRAQVIANAMAQAFVDRFQAMRTEQAQKTSDLLKSQLEQAEKNLALARQKFDQFSSSHSFGGSSISTEADAAAKRVQDATLKRDDLNQRLADARAQLQVNEAAIKNLPATITKPNLQRVTDPIVTELRRKLMAKDDEIRPMAARYSDTYPALKKAQTERDSIAKQLQEEEARTKGSATITEPNPERVLMAREIYKLQGDVQGLSAQLPTAEAAIAAANAEMGRYRNITTPVTALSQDVNSATAIVDALRVREQAADLALDAARSQQPIAIADLVSDNFNPPINAAKGRNMKLIILAFLAALIGTSAIVIALDSVDRRVKTVGQANLALPARIVAAIPQPTGNVSYANLARATEMMPSSLQSEAYRFLGLQLLSPRGPRIRSLMVLSAKAEQGSTTTVTNLAITLAQAGKKVILIDANVRTAELHKVFETPNEFGFTDLLRDPSSDKLDQALKPTGVANLEIITSGPLTDNAWQLFRSDNLIELSRKLHDRADFVLYDTPSALIFTDALNLAPVVDAAFLCVRALEPLTGAEQRVTELLEQNNVQVLGSVLNDVPPQVVEGYHNYQHYYGGPGGGMPALAGRADSSVPLIEMPAAGKGGRKNGAG